MLTSTHRPAQMATDKELARALVAREVWAAEEVARVYWPDAYRVARMLLGEERAAEDAAQDAIVSAIRSIETFDEERALRPWIERIAANRAVDLLRSQRRRREVPLEEMIVEGDASEDIAADLARHALLDDIVAALTELDADQRTAVVLRHLLDYEPVEIADLVGATPGAVRSRIHRGVVGLREILREREGGENNERVG